MTMKVIDMTNPTFPLDFPGTAVITDNGDEVSYAEMKRLTERWEPSIPARALVFLLVGNNLQSLVAYVACINRGIVPLMLSMEIDGGMLRHLIEVYKPSYVWRCRDGIAEKIDGGGVDLHPSLALLLTTSGSVGSPKLVRQSYENISANTSSIIEYLMLDETERPITTLPMNYTYGLSIINTHLNVGATILLTEKTLMQREFWNFFTSQNATSFGGVPYTYEMLDKLLFFRRRLPSLRTMTQAGGKITPELHRKFAEYALREGKHFVVMYGQCEATARMAYLPPEKSLEKIGSMGIAIPGGQFRLIDENGNVIHDADVTGELVYEGPNVTLGYAEKAEDLNRWDDFHGILLTGDMARRDADGFYSIVGRKKRFLKIFGNRVNLDETERLIKGHFSGIDCACGGKDDQMVIYITDKNMQDIVQEYIAAMTHLNFKAFKVVTVEAIPKNEAGKTLYGVLETLNV